MTDDPTDERKIIYKDYRAAKRHLKEGRDFADGMKIARGYDQARREAMHRAGTNVPQGAAYREEFAKIDRREKLIDRDDQGREFPDKEARTYCIYMLENYDAPSHDPRRPSIKTWRDGMSVSERAKLNHPKRVWTGYLAATEPRAERDAKRAEREMRPPKENPHLAALADAEVERDASRRETETLRELLARIRDELREHLSPDLLDAIAKALQ
jgi:DNA segregation ATPase FtsK/SpoIIIE-like protein